MHGHSNIKFTLTCSKCQPDDELTGSKQAAVRILYKDVFDGCLFTSFSA